jgi:hypothetical protein
MKSNRDERDQMVRFNIQLTRAQNKRAELVAKLLNKPKQTLVEDLFMAAIKDAETELGVLFDEGYIAYLNSEEPVLNYIERRGLK